MRLTLWGTRGSLPCAGPDTVSYGGETSAVQVTAGDTVVVLDTGTGIRRLGDTIGRGVERLDILLTHLHLDHIQGLGFFRPLLDPDTEVHVWGPASDSAGLARHLGRYLSPPLFPVRIRDLQGVTFHDLRPGSFAVGPLTVTADLVCHPGLTLGYRVEAGSASVAYLPDHEPALGNPRFPGPPEWTSGHALARGVDLLIHDTQYTPEEYRRRVGWGHSSYRHALAFAGLAEVDALVTFHHDPWHSDRTLDRILAEMRSGALGLEVIPGRVGTVIELDETTGSWSLEAPAA